MGLVKISDLPSAAVLTGAELIELSQGGFSRKGTSSLFAVLNLANVFTVFQTIRSAGGVNLRIENTGASINSYFGVDGSAGYAGTSSNHAFNLYTNNALRLAISGGGNTTIAAPSSGVTLSLTTTAALGGEALQLVEASVRSWQIRAGGLASNFFDIADITRGQSVFSISANGNVNIAAPASGDTLTVNTLSSQGLRISTGAASSGAALYLSQTGQSPAAIYQGGSASDFRIYVNGADRINVGSAGNVSINAPSSGNALIVNGLSGNSTIAAVSTGGAGSLNLGWNVGLSGSRWNINSNSTDSLSIGAAGSGNLDFWTNAIQRIAIATAGNVTVNAPSSGNSLLVNAAAAATGIAFSDGTVTGWAADFGATRHNFGTSSNHSSNWYSNNTQRVVLAAAGNVTINAPSSGVALTVNGSTQVDTGAVIWTIAEDGSGAYLDLSGSNNFRIYTGSAERIRVGNTGIVTINAPSSDTALILPAAATGYSSMRLPHGTAPTTPVDGDMWTTTAGLFVRINGATVGPLT